MKVIHFFLADQKEIPLWTECGNKIPTKPPVLKQQSHTQEEQEAMNLKKPEKEKRKEK